MTHAGASLAKSPLVTRKRSRRPPHTRLAEAPLRETLGNTHGTRNLCRMPDPSTGLRFASLYSGAGGLDLGFVNAGFEPAWAVEFDPHAAATYAGLLGSHIRHQDIDDATRPLPTEHVDLLVGGPPCQGFSVAGKMDPHDPRSRHVWRFLEVADAIKPTAFVMENVKALGVNARWGPVRDGLIAEAKRMGYTPTLVVLRASDFGVPQRRERMFLVGTRNGRTPNFIPVGGPTPTVRAAFAELPAFGEPGNNTKCSAGITPAKRPIMRPTAYRGSLLFNGNGRPLDPGQPAPTLPASMGGNATPIVDQRQLETGGKSWVEEYHRSLLAGVPPAPSVPECLRRITVEEAAALQTFPQGVRWSGPLTSQYRQVGNAVPPLLAYHVACAVRDCAWEAS